METKNVGEVDKIVKEFLDSGAKAMSVTAPFKAMAYQLADQHNLHTQNCHTGNLLIKSDTGLTIDNTDGVGLIEDIKRMNYSLKDKKILFIGNGSVIHSVLSAIEAEDPECIHLLMRNYDNLAQFKLRNNNIACFDNAICYDIIINTTPNSPENQLFMQINQLNDDALIYDMIYTQPTTLFMQTMQNINNNITTVNGIGMLIQQAKIAFIKVFNQTPNVDSLYAYFKDKFK